MTDECQVEVRAQFLEDQSQVETSRYVFSYRVLITNRSDAAITLVSRHWIIVDGNEKKQEVRGDGVVGEQPTIEPGDSYSYTSGAVLATATGLMQGSYRMRREDGSSFDATIPAFALAPASALH